MEEKMQKINEILHKLSIYNPHVAAAIISFLQDPRNLVRKTFLFSLNLLYYSIKTFKKIWNRNESIIKNNISIHFPSIKQVKEYNVAVIIAELSIPQCKTYRVDSKKKILNSLGYKVYVISWQNQTEAVKYMQLADFVIFYRVPFFVSVEKLYNEADRLCLKKFYDIDDLIFDAHLYKEYLNQSKMNLNRERQELLNGAELYRQAILHADVFLTSTQAIKYLYDDLHLHRKSYVFPNGLSEEALDVRKLNKIKRESDKIRIFYGSGSKTHDADFDLISKPVACILRDYKNVELYIIGQLELSSIFDKYKEQIHRISRLSAENYFQEISQYDIALMPLTDCVFNKCKSNIKYIEASILNIPSVASNIYEFSHAIIDGVNGFLASTEDEWYKKIEQLILDKNLRKNMAQKAFQNCELLYGEKKQNELFKYILEKEIVTTETQLKKFKILLVNLYYGVNSFGGATVVVENLAKEMSNLPNEQIEVSVFTTHSYDDVGMGTLRKYEFEGIPVYSCSSQINEGGAIENPTINKCFEDIIQIVKPDVVHFHAVQGFGYGLSKICRYMDVPYVITCHDRWAYCPKLFMFDTNGEYCIKYGTSVDVCEHNCHLNADWMATRRNKLYKMLKNASQLYVPSFYAKTKLEELYPDFQFLVNKNGIENFEGKGTSPKRKTLRFLFVAGEEKSKGFDLIHQVMMELLNYEWELILLMPNGTPKAEWPQGRVKILKKQNREQMKRIYQNVDVLLFPSLAYESFGLTVREAIRSDCFVIVSNCGGPTEAIHNGENGFIVPIGDSIALKNAIEKILNNSEQYLNYKTKYFGDIRSYQEQAEELIRYYKTIN